MHHALVTLRIVGNKLATTESSVNKIIPLTSGISLMKQFFYLIHFVMCLYIWVIVLLEIDSSVFGNYI